MNRAHHGEGEGSLLGKKEIDEFLPEIETTHYQSFDHMKAVYNDRFSFKRKVNHHLIGASFHYNGNPYTDSFIFDHSGKGFYIDRKTGIVSIISAKHSRLRLDNHHQSVLESQKNELYNAIVMTNDFVLKRNQSDKGKIAFSTTNIASSGDQFQKEVTPTWKDYRSVLMKLYQTTQVYHQEFWEQESPYGKMLILTEEGREYFSTIISELYIYAENTDFFGKNWIKNLFPENSFSIIRAKIKQRKLLTTKDICDLVLWLVTKQHKQSDPELDSETTARYLTNTLKSSFLNALYSSLYTEQSYHYFRMKKLSQGFAKAIIDNTAHLIQTHNYAPEDISTQVRFKDLPSLSFKELRGKFAQDEHGSKTRVPAKMLSHQGQSNYDFLSQDFENKIETLVTYYDKLGYTVSIKEFEVESKFNRGNKYNIFFKKEELQTKVVDPIKKKFSSHFGGTLSGFSKRKKIKDFYSYEITNLDNEYFDSESLEAVQEALHADMKDTGGNGDYADVKFRMIFELIHKQTNEVIDNQSYEHMIVNLDSTNEGDLSDHNIFLNPLKNLALALNSSGVVDFVKFFESVSGGIDATIASLNDFHYYLDHPSEIPQGLTQQFIEQQLEIRKKIPGKILALAGINYPLNYLELDQNPQIKKKIQEAIAKYLLEDMFTKGKLHRFIYNADEIDTLSPLLSKNLLKGKKSSLSYDHQELFQKALHNIEKGKYHLCGGGSNNLAKMMNSGLCSPHAYIGVVRNKKIHFFTTPFFAGIISDGTKIIDKSIILGTMKEKIQSPKGEESSHENGK